VVTGGIEIVGADGRAYAPRERATLCRCGVTRNQPFCDGGHDDVDLGD
jgi:CDGSH-type Zn-finger protein